MLLHLGHPTVIVLGNHAYFGLLFPNSNITVNTKFY